MAYAVMTTWKHKNPIDWKEMASEDFSKMPKGTTVQWFAIDEYNHGSFATYLHKAASVFSQSLTQPAGQKK